MTKSVVVTAQQAGATFDDMNDVVVTAQQAGATFEGVIT